MVSRQGFQQLMSTASLGYQPPHRTMISRTYIPEIYSEVHEKVDKAYAPAAHHIAFTTDHWTNLKSDSYTTVTGLFINDDWYLINTVLTTQI